MKWLYRGIPLQIGGNTLLAPRNFVHFFKGFPVTTSILAGLKDIQSLNRMCPKKDTVSSQKLHLEYLAYNNFSRNICNTVLKGSTCFSTTTSIDKNMISLKTLFIQSIKGSGALVTPKGIIRIRNDRSVFETPFLKYHHS